ncbi:MAG: acyltransferase [Thalassotalea sp.]|nr:acyltransferase [Thalassotalea sp.]
MIKLKKLISWLFSLLVSPLLFAFLILKIANKADSAFPAFSQTLSLFPGKVGSYLRIGFYRYTMPHCSSNCMISFGVLFSQLDTEIFYGVYIGPQSNIGSCVIEENCLLGSAVHILSGKRQHNYSNPNIPLKDQGGEFSKVTIGANTWIGNGAIVMANVGSNCVIAAGSVVTQDVADNSIMAGNPAVFVKQTNG